MSSTSDNSSLSLESLLVELIVTYFLISIFIGKNNKFISIKNLRKLHKKVQSLYHFSDQLLIFFFLVSIKVLNYKIILI